MALQSNMTTNRFSLQRFPYSWKALMVLLFLCLISIVIIPQSSHTMTTIIPDGRTEWVAAGMTPKGLASADWNSITAQIAARPYQVVADRGSSYLAYNPAHHWRINYAEDGTTKLTPQGNTSAAWQWGLKLTNYGYGAGQTLSRPIALSVDEQTLTYQWDANLSEWWINSDEGLEQGFTLLERPQSPTNSIAPLVLEMVVNGDLRPVVTGDTIQLLDPSGETILTYNKLHVSDANGRTVPAHFASVPSGASEGTSDVSAARIQITVNDAGAVYPLTIDPTVQQAYVKASNTQSNDRFGRAVAVSGDTVVIAAYGEDSDATGINGNQTSDSANDSGAAYVFVRSGGVWSQQAYLKASNTGAGDWFGWSVAIQDDIVVVGAPFEDSSSTGVNGADNDAALNSGAAYVYSRTGSVWSQEAYLKASNTESADRFGISVAVSGNTVVVGANGEDSDATGVNGSDNNSASGSGAAYVFTRGGGTWSQQAYLKASNTGMDDNFGISVAVSNDTIVVGANGEDSNSTGVNGLDNDLAADSGAAYVFTRSAGTWSQQAFVKASNTGGGDSFGDSAAASGDTIVVGAGGEASSATGVNGNEADDSRLGAGAAYVFSGSGGTWGQEAYLKQSNTDAGDNFGNSLAIEGDAVIVGAFIEDGSSTGINGPNNNAASDSGAAYLFTRSGGTWTLEDYIKASNTDSSDLFGVSVSVSGDTLVVGARGESSSATGIGGNQADDSAAGSGAAYIFREEFCSNQSGDWSSASTWVGGAVPGSTADACISIGDTVVLDTAAAVDSLTVYPDAALDLGTFDFTAETSVINHGNLLQTRTVNNDAVNFLVIQDVGATTTQYRGVTITATTNMQNLGDVEVSVRETVDWYPVFNSKGVNYIQYCTNARDASPTYAQRCFRITPTNQPTADVTVRLWGLTSELNGIAEADLSVFRYAGGINWVELATNASNGNDGGAYSYAEGDTSDFSEFLLAEANNDPTAVSLRSITVAREKPYAVLVALSLMIGLILITWQARRKMTA